MTRQSIANIPALRLPSLAVVSALLVSGCQNNEERVYELPDASGQPVAVISAAAETDPVASSEDAADDAVVLVPADGNAAWIVGADKRFGLRVYALDGSEVDAFNVGRLNNVDAIRTGDDEFLLAASNRTTLAIDLFRAVIEDDELTITIADPIPLALLEPYGLCAASIDGATSIFVGNRSGRVEEWQIDADGRGIPARVFEFPSQTEGCVVDIPGNRLFVGEEDVGIWSVDFATGDQVLVAQTGGVDLTADVEGLDIYADGSQRYLVASSQGSHSFAVYRLPEVDLVATFRIGPDATLGIDGVLDSDGVAVTSAALPGYPAGVLVVQDGFNEMPKANQNFKIVDWRVIEEALSLSE